MNEIIAVAKEDIEKGDVIFVSVRTAPYVVRDIYGNPVSAEKDITNQSEIIETKLIEGVE